jgi:DnaJ-class molecular chaperone
MEDYMRLFQLPGNWTMDQLRPAYRLLAKKYHPDANLNNTEADAQFKFVNQAFEALSRIGGGTAEPEKPEPPKPKNATPAQPPTSNRVEVADKFDILNDFVNANRGKKSTEPPPTPSSPVKDWFKKFFKK